MICFPRRRRGAAQETAPGGGYVASKTSSSLAKDHAVPILLPLLIVIVGLCIGGTVLGLDIPNQVESQNERFLKVADEAFLKLQYSLDDYQVSGLWLHQSCRNRNLSHERFRVLYEYITSTGLDYQAVSCALNVSADERLLYENQSRAYLAENYPSATYIGFTSLVSPADPPELMVMPNVSHYFVNHFVEPLEDPYNQEGIDFDVSTATYYTMFTQALETGKLSVTARLEYLPPPEDKSQAYEYSLIMASPGIPTTFDNDATDIQGVAILLLKFHSLLQRAYREIAVNDDIFVYIYDSTDSVIEQDGHPSFLGGVRLSNGNMSFTQEVHYSDVFANEGEHGVLLTSENSLTFAAREWKFVAVGVDEAYKPDYFLTIFGAVMIIVASICAALWIFSRSKARAEKSAILLASAKNMATAERELNDFIAHEVRNPLSAAISANSFVSLAVSEAKPLVTNESRESIREDVRVIGNSLQYINDLLRSMLDSHRAQNQQITLQKKHVDLRQDVFIPVTSMLYRRGCSFEVLIDCPEDLLIMSDPLRLKQIILNLALNAAKFVVKGFVRMGAFVNKGVVCLFVEDSGPGIPSEKSEHIFQKFQQSLDSLNQGTGIGLSLCKQLVELMHGEICLDKSYNSGIDGHPGARFTVTLPSPPTDLAVFGSSAEGGTFAESSASNKSNHSNNESFPVTDSLPDSLSIMFVDDDFILRKLFSRSVKRCRPNWIICEAASGEAALQLIDERGPKSMFDVIFLDQYMASTQKQLLGTETVRLLRSKGVDSVICGLSANNIAPQFIEAGADCFVMKPFPCEISDLTRELQRVLHSRENAPSRLVEEP